MKTNLINKISTAGIAVAVFGLVALSNPFSTGANDSGKVGYGYGYGSSPVIPTIACDSRVSGSACSTTSISGNTTSTTENKTETTTTTVNTNGSTTTTNTSTTEVTNTTSTDKNVNTTSTTNEGTTTTNTTNVKDTYVADSAETGIKNYVKVLPKTGASN